jgi:hypothetical protein
MRFEKGAFLAAIGYPRNFSIIEDANTVFKFRRAVSITVVT